MEAGANGACEHRTTRQSCSRALLSAEMHSGSGTTSDVSRHEPQGPKPAVVGRVSCPAAKLTLRLQVNPPIRRPACRLAAADPEFAICESTMRGSREAVVPAGDRIRRKSGRQETSEAGRCRSTLLQLVRVRTGRTTCGESASRRSAKAGRRIQRCAEQAVCRSWRRRIALPSSTLLPARNRSRTSARSPHRGEHAWSNVGDHTGVSRSRIRRSGSRPDTHQAHLRDRKSVV